MLRRFGVEVGKAFRETGQALDRLGARAQGDYTFLESWSRHRTLMNLFDKRPFVAVDAFVAPNASVIGDVKVMDRSSVWYGAVLRGDTNKIRVGANTNIRDNVVVQVSRESGDGFPTSTSIGSFVSVLDGAVLSSCVVEDYCIIGQRAVVLDGALIEKNSIVEAGSVVPPGRRIPAGQVWGGNPAVYIRDANDDDMARITNEYENAKNVSDIHQAEFLPYGTAYLQLVPAEGYEAPQKEAEK